MAIARFPSVILDCDDPGRMARFYGDLLDWRVSEDDGWGEVRNAAGDQCICFQKVEHYRPPQWPGQDVPQQMHLDVMVGVAGCDQPASRCQASWGSAGRAATGHPPSGITMATGG